MTDAWFHVNTPTLPPPEAAAAPGDLIVLGHNYNQVDYSLSTDSLTANLALTGSRAGGYDAAWRTAHAVRPATTG